MNIVTDFFKSFRKKGSANVHDIHAKAVEDMVEARPSDGIPLGGEGSPYINVDVEGVVFNYLIDKLVKVVTINSTEETDFIIKEVKVQHGRFYVKGDFIFDRDDVVPAEDWISQDSIYINVYW